jgi:hypothetical protein
LNIIEFNLIIITRDVINTSTPVFPRYSTKYVKVLIELSHSSSDIFTCNNPVINKLDKCFSNCGPWTISDPQDVPEEKAKQKLYQTLNG